MRPAVRGVSRFSDADRDRETLGERRRFMYAAWGISA